ncbi:MAG: S-methyl-5-thioribose-1-phosphate isomerase [Bacillota bacterium]|nr:S-methyl-5-thioribose-1-phosphate isomerase [Bacillota bacterium]
MNDINRITHVNNVSLREDGKAVVIIDQSLLPNKTEFIELDTPEKMYEAILHLRVRGAPAIGICAGYCMAVLAKKEAEPKPIRGCCSSGSADEVFLENMKKHGEYLKSSRPTAVNLAWAVGRILTAVRVEIKKAKLDSGIMANVGYDRLAEVVRMEAVAIHNEDIEMCKAISEFGLSLVKDGDGILTHCNAGPLATSRYGTALGPILLGKERGMEFKVFADETRPLLQGARLTAYELQMAGVDVTLICDNMASMVMRNGWVQACFVGCDRVAANGDTANKIGTSGVAILAKHYGIPFYVLGPTSTIDMDCPTGKDIPIELRDPAEIKQKFYEMPMSLDDVKCYNPAFDVTDNELITAIVTEKGVCRPPFTESLRAVTEK